MCDNCLVTATECACRCWNLHFTWRRMKKSEHRSYRNAELECAGCRHRQAVEDTYKRRWWMAYFNTDSNEPPLHQYTGSD